jgi:hypothetical protein
MSTSPSDWNLILHRGLQRAGVEVWPLSRVMGSRMWKGTELEDYVVKDIVFDSQRR